MSKVDFSDHLSVAAWTHGLSMEMCCTYSSRAALRVFANIDDKETTVNPNLFLRIFRAVLIATWRGIASAEQVASYERPSNTTNAVHFLYAGNKLRGSGSHSAFAAAENALFSVVDADGSIAAADCIDNSDDSVEYTRSDYGSGTIQKTNDSPAFRAVRWDSENITSPVHQHPVWMGVDVPAAIQDNHQNLLTSLPADPAWRFWLRFYEGMWNGTFDEWDLAFEVVQIDEEHWKKGYERIGEEIAGIERRLRPALNRTQLKEQAQRLAAAPLITSSIGDSTARIIEDVIQSFMMIECANTLPEPLLVLHHLPTLLRSIGSNAHDKKVEELEKQIEQLVGEVQTLTSALAAAKGRSGAVIAKEQAIKSTVACLTVGFWGSVAAGVSHMTGVVDVGSLLERFGDIATDPPTIDQIVAPDQPEITEI